MDLDAVQPARRPDGRRALFLAVLIAAAAVGGAGAARSTLLSDAPTPTFDYRVLPTDGPTAVEVRITGFACGIELGFTADERILGIRNLRFSGPDGHLHHSTRIEMVDQARKRTRKWHRIEGSPPEVLATFDIEPPPDFNKNGDGQRFGLAGRTTVLAGAHLILVPRSSSCGTGSITLPSHSIAGRPWSYASESELQELLDRRFAVGPELSATGGGWRLHLAPSYDSATRVVFEKQFAVFLQEVRARVAWWTELPWDLALAPRAGDSVRVAEMSAPDFVFLDADRPYPRLWGQALLAWTAARTRGEWFSLGLARLLEGIVADRLAPHLPRPLEAIAEAASDDPVGYDDDLLGPLPPDRPRDQSANGRSLKAGLILSLVDQALSKAGEDGIWKAARLARIEPDPLRALALSGGQALSDRVRTWCGPSGFPLRRIPSFRFEPSPAAPGPEGQLTLCFGGSGRGELESCGCSSGMAGGLARRAAVLKALPGPVVSIDLGNCLTLKEGRRLPEEDEEEQRKYLELLEEMGIDALIPGTAELCRGWECFERLMRGRRLAIGGLQPAGRPLENVLWIRKERLRIAIVGFTESCLPDFKNRTFGDAPDPCDLPPDMDRLGEVLGRIVNADLVVVAGWISAGTLRRILDRHGDRIDVILNDNTAARHGAPVLERTTRGGMVGRTLVLFHALAGKGITVSRLSLSGSHRVVAFDSRAVVLDESVAEDPITRDRITAFYEESARRELAATGGRAQPLVDWDPAFHGPFAGTDRCIGCHADQAREHRTTRHALAFNTLVRAGRHTTTRCTPCHVVGFALPTGWNPASPTDRLRNVGCESCHGAGGEHVDRPRKENIRKTPLKQTCLSCHDPKHSPDFEATFHRRWEAVKH